MCGICGQVGMSESKLLQAMCDSLIHRGPDDEGQYFHEKAALGIRRLSVIDVKGGHQPMCNEDRHLWVVCNGEIYNFLALRSSLEKKGHSFRTKSDTEVILHAYEEYGENCLKHFNGMFAFAIWDEKEEVLFLARDRLGIKPLFYWHNGRYLLFGSEIKAILQDSNFQREINITALYNYLSRLFVPGEETIFRDIRRLPPAHILKFKDSHLKIKRYWHPDFSNKLSMTEEDYCDNIYEHLKAAVRRRLITEVPLGAFLSGGVDSSGIVALMSEICGQPVKTFSLGFIEAEDTLLNELPYAREVAERFGTDHQEFVVKASDLIQELPHMIWHFDEPFSGALAQYFLSSLARKNVTVALGGLGGDELFGSYGRSVRLSSFLKGRRVVSLYQSLPKPLRKCLIEKIVPISPTTGLLGEFRRHAEEVIYYVGRVYANRYGPFDKDLKDNLCQELVLQQVNPRLTLDRLLQEYYDETNASELMDRMMWVDMSSELVNEYLNYTDILSMACSLEMRVPYLDHEFMEFVANIPPVLRSKPEDTKYLLKKTLARVLPPEMLYHEKGTFSLPYGSWMYNELKDWVRCLLSPERVKVRGYFDTDFVSSLVYEYYEGGKVEHTYRLWSLLMFELWHQIYIDDHCYRESDLQPLQYYQDTLPQY